MANDWSELRMRCRELALALGISASKLPAPTLTYRELEAYWYNLIDRGEEMRRAQASNTSGRVSLSSM